jgi:hypothetical protein
LEFTAIPGGLTIACTITLSKRAKTQSTGGSNVSALINRKGTPMSGLAALAVHDVAVASVAGTSLPAGLTPSVIDGFAAGALLSGLCLLLVMAPRRILRRRRPTVRGAAWASAQHQLITPDLSAYAARPAKVLAATILDSLADESAEVVVCLPGREARVPTRRPEARVPTRRPEARVPTRRPEPTVPTRRPEAKRSSGRHAAPPVGVGNRMVSKLALHPLAARE